MLKHKTNILSKVLLINGLLIKGLLIKSITVISCLLLLTQLFGCGAIQPKKPEKPVKEITPQERAQIEKIKKDLPRIHASLLKAAAPLSKKQDCQLPLEIIYNDKTPNAYCDGKKVYITETMLKNFSNSEEAAITLSHEIAHGLMGHVRAKQTNILLGTVLDVAVAVAGGVTNPGIFSRLAGNTYSKEFELEADYVGLYLMARAGFPVNNAAKFWRKMALQSPHHIENNFASSHPGSAQRYVLLEKTAQEINEKKRMKLDLVPEYKKRRV